MRGTAGSTSRKPELSSQLYWGGVREKSNAATDSQVVRVVEELEPDPRDFVSARCLADQSCSVLCPEVKVIGH